MEIKKLYTSECMPAVQAYHSGTAYVKGSEVVLHEYHHAQSLEQAHTEVEKGQKTGNTIHL